MAIIDIILLICFVPAIISGISNGFVKQLVKLLSLLLGIWASFKFASVVTAWLSKYIEGNETVLKIISYVLILVVVVLILNLLGNLLTRLLKAISLGWADKVLGLVFGIVQTAFILGLLILLVESLNDSLEFIKPGSLDNATVYQSIKNLSEDVFPYLKDFFTQTAEPLIESISSSNA